MGISADQVDRQMEFDEANALGFALLSDPSRSVAKQFGVKRPGPVPSKRVTFVIDDSSVCLAVITSELKMHQHADEALEVLRRR